MDIPERVLGFLVGTIVVVLVMPLGLWAARRNYRGEDPAERRAARERENAPLREVAGAPNLNYLLAMVWARWLGLTRRDRRVVKALWVTMAALFLVILSVDSARSGLDIQDAVAFLVLAPLVTLVFTIVLIFRMRM